MKDDQERIRIGGSGFNVVRKPGLMRRVLTTMATAAVLVLGLMFSAVVFVILALVGIAVGIYLWWKTRDFRQRMDEEIREQQERSAWTKTADQDRPETGSVYEGEVVEVNEIIDPQQIDAPPGCAPHQENADSIRLP